MYVFVSTVMYECMHVCICETVMYECMYECICETLETVMYDCMHVCICEYSDVCMSVCMYVFISTEASEGSERTTHRRVHESTQCIPERAAHGEGDGKDQVFF